MKRSCDLREPIEDYSELRKINENYLFERRIEN